MNLQEAIERGRYNAAHNIKVIDDEILKDWIYHSTSREYEQFANAIAHDMIENDYDVPEEFIDPPELAKEKLEKFWQKMGGNDKKGQAPVSVPFYKNRFVWLASAMIILCATGIYYWQSHQGAIRDMAVSLPPAEHPATITLPDGVSQSIANVSGVDAQVDTSFTRVILGDTSSRRYINHSSGGITNLSEVAYNSISTRAGKRYKVFMFDGSIVTLNALSTLWYSTAAAGARKVKLEGEAFFDVTPDNARPFIVKTRYAEVRVLGTRFNISSYNNEKLDWVTLVSGAVNVNNNIDATNKTLGPGEQLAMGMDRNDLKKVDTSDVISWTAGYFGYKRTHIGQIMRELERWYDVKVEYAGPEPYVNISLDATRKTPLEVLMPMLGIAGIRCDLKGKTLKITYDHMPI